MNKVDKKILNQIIDDLIDNYDKNEMKKLIDEMRHSGKPFYLSKTLWVNIIACATIMIQARYGFIVSPELQGVALVIINIILRAITKEELST